MNPREYYTTKVEQTSSAISTLKRKLRLLSLSRLLVFVGTFLGVYLLFPYLNALLLVVAPGLVLFLYLLNRYSFYKHRLRYQEAMLDLNERELRYLDRNISDNTAGNEYIFEGHAYNQDIDLFGEGSLFQMLNRTALKNGERHLATILNSNNIDGILEKQAAVQELAKLPDWRQNYTTTAALIESKISSNSIVTWIKSHQKFVPTLYRWFPIAFSIISLLLIIALSLNLISPYTLGAWFVLGVTITGRFVKKVTKMYNATSEIDDLLRQYSQLLKAIEEHKFTSTSLQELQKKVLKDGKPASQLLAELSSDVGSLGNRNIMLFGFLANGLFLWDLRFAYRIEKWIGAFDGALDVWVQVIEEMDAQNSLGNFAFNHPAYIYPEVSSGKNLQFKADDLGHPLLDPKKRVNNSISMQEQEFFIVTGANMAGKSTFLRTVAMNLVMANCGMPVCAETFEYTPIKLISSMRTSDSLVNDESYFFSELKRLKFIVETLETDSYFIILDEILKGTNSIDKAEGSKKFVQRLVASNSTGLIATHDLSLCTLSDDHDEIVNYYFDAEIVDNELYFDYKFKDGICQNMNASFLLKKMGIVK